MGRKKKVEVEETENYTVENVYKKVKGKRKLVGHGEVVVSKTSKVKE